ncbi:MAG: hypothetical protein ACU84Q_20570 [Gammaproteobacteria bacterium]
MNWDAVGAIGEVLGALVVIATLLYLARQVTLQGAAASSDAMASWLSDYNSLVLQMFRDRDSSEIIRRGLTDFHELDGTDQMRFHSWMIIHLINAQTVYLQSKRDVQDRQTAEAILNFNGSMLKLDGGLQWWQGAREALDPDFVQEMDRRIESSAPVSDIFPWFVVESNDKHLA